MIRIGQSEDIHRLVKGRDLMIGGVKIPYEFGLDGHSDADVLLHAIIESLIGAMGLYDIGHHFSDKDPRFKGISSLKLLDATAKLLHENGYRVINIDSLIMIEKPKMAPYIDKMRENIAGHLNIDKESVNVKATCAEGLGYIGRGEGAKAQAVCLIEKL